MNYNTDDLERALEKVVEGVGLSHQVYISKLGNRLTITYNGSNLYYIFGYEVSNCVTQKLFVGSSTEIVCSHINDNLMDTLNKFSIMQNSFNLNSILVESKLRDALGFPFHFNVLGSNFHIETNCNRFNIYYIGNGKYKVESQMSTDCTEHDMNIIAKATEALEGLML